MNVSLHVKCFLSGTFDLDKDNALHWAMKVADHGGNLFFGAVTVYLRQRVMLSMAAFDALTVYHDHVTPIYLEEHREHDHERTRRNKNIAVLYAHLGVLR